MNKHGSLFDLDWVVITARWVFVVSASLWLALNSDMDGLVFSILALMGIFNVFLSILAFITSLSQTARVSSTIFDFIIVYLLIRFAHGTGQEVQWMAFLPLFSAGFYFRWIGACIGILINILGLAALASPFAFNNRTLLEAGGALLAYCLVGLGAAYLSTRLQSEKRVSRISRSSFARLHEKKEHNKRQTLYALVSKLSTTLNYQTVLDTSLDLAANALAELDAPVDRLVSVMLLFSGKDPNLPELRIVSARHILSTDKSLALPGERGALRRVIEEGKTIHILDPKNDPELGKIIALHECHSAYVLPLRTGLDTYGVLLFAHPEPEYFTDDRRDLLNILRNQSTVAIQNARLYQAIEQEKNRMMEIQEESRQKLARDLHDGPTQSVSAIAMRVNFARRLMERDPKKASEELFRIEDLARRTTKEIRHMLFTLRPLVLESQGLVAALESMAEKMRETFNQTVVIQVDPHVVELLELGKQGVIFYIIEEAVNNARKHAKAPNIWVRIKMLREGLSLLEIEDDGVGFDKGEVDASYEKRGSLGLLNMRERTELVNGVLKIDSANDRGTRVQVYIPLTEEATDLLRRGI